MARIAFCATKYHWESYSIVRSLYDAMVFLGHRIEYCTDGKVHSPTDVALVASSTVPIPSRAKFPVVVFGFSDPNMFSDARRRRASLYVTASLQIAKKYPDCFYLPLFADSRYFKPVLSKHRETADCVFIGKGNHKVVSNRQVLVDNLRRAGVRVQTFGPGWTPHHDSHKFVSGESFVRAISHGKIGLDLSNRSTSVSSRIFQYGMCGVPIVTFDRRDVRQLMYQGKEIEFYSSLETLLRTVQGLLADRELRRRQGHAARVRCLAEHDVIHRVSALDVEFRRRFGWSLTGEQAKSS